MSRHPSERSGSLRPMAVSALLVWVVCALVSGVQARDSRWTAPAAATQRINPLASGGAAAAGGLKLFRERCSNCHGREAAGNRMAPDLTAPAVQAQSDGTLFWKITQGNTRRGMPTFSYLPDPQRWQLVLHLRSLRPRHDTPAQTPAESPCASVRSDAPVAANAAGHSRPPDP